MKIEENEGNYSVYTIIRELKHHSDIDEYNKFTSFTYDGYGHFGGFYIVSTVQTGEHSFDVFAALNLNERYVKQIRVRFKYVDTNLQPMEKIYISDCTDEILFHDIKSRELNKIHEKEFFDITNIKVIRDEIDTISPLNIDTIGDIGTIGLRIDNIGLKNINDIRLIKNFINNYSYEYFAMREEKAENMIKTIQVNEEKRLTTVVFNDGDVRIATCDKDDEFDAVVGVAMCISAHIIGSKTKFKKLVKDKVHYHKKKKS